MTDHTMSMQSLIPIQTLEKYIASIKVTHGVEVLHDTWMQPLCILYNVTCIITYTTLIVIFYFYLFHIAYFLHNNIIVHCIQFKC